MSLLSAILIGLLMGVVFGIALEKSRVFEPGIIVGQMQLSNCLMLKVFITAIVTSALVLVVLNGLGFVPLYPKPTFYLADIVGGLLLGAGIALAGACPGTVLAQVGVGYKDAIFTLIGGLVGAIAYGYAEPTLKPILMSGGPGKITLADLTGVPYWILALGFALALILLLRGMERCRSCPADPGKDLDGDK